MFRCTECGSEYKTKPDFCDCGNDTFEEVYEPLPKSEKIKQPLNINKLDILSWLIFTICLVLSLLVLLFFPKIEPQNETKPQKPELNKPVQNIPSLESFWIDPVPQPEIIEPEIRPIEQIKEIFKPKVEKKPAAKPKPIQKKQVQQKPVQQTQSKPTPTQTNIKKTGQQTVKTPVHTNRSLDYAMLNYRSALRMRLLSNLVHSGIVGEGNCEIEFSIDETGKLVNRRFVKQSSNETVNKAVYEMLMRTPRYNPPPSSYDGRKIRMTFKLSEGGNFETSFTN